MVEEQVQLVVGDSRRARRPQHSSAARCRTLSGEITKQARQFLIEKLDMDSRRQIIFMDREDILTLAVQTGLQLPSESKQASADDIPC